MNSRNDDAADDERRQRQREEGRSWAYELQKKAEADGQDGAWFEALYKRASGDAGFIPWEMAAPRFKLEAWLGAHPGAGRRAIDVGCGLGDNARCLAEAGYDVTAFDLSETATDWARKRFPDQRISFQQGDVFDLPAQWRGAFDLVHETYNLQAMPQGRLDEAMRGIASLAAPGGRVLVMARAREAGEAVSGPPWPLSRAQLQGFHDAGLREVHFETFDDQRSEPIRHFLAVYER